MRVPCYHHHKLLLTCKPKASLSFPDFPKQCVQTPELTPFYFAFAVMFITVFTLLLRKPYWCEDTLLIYSSLHSTQHRVSAQLQLGEQVTGFTWPYMAPGAPPQQCSQPPPKAAKSSGRTQIQESHGCKASNTKRVHLSWYRPLSFGEGSPDTPLFKSSPRSTETSLGPVFHPQSISQ